MYPSAGAAQAICPADILIPAELLSDPLDTIAEKEQEKLDQLFEAKRVEPDNLTNTYEEKIALQTPVKYWNLKKKKHRCLALVFGLVLAIAMALSGIFGIKAVNSLFAMTRADQSPDHWRIGNLLVIADLYF